MTSFRDIFLIAAVDRHGTVRLQVSDRPLELREWWSLISSSAQSSEEQDPTETWSFNLRDIPSGVVESFGSSRWIFDHFSPALITQATQIWRDFLNGPLRQKIASLRESPSDSIRINIIGTSPLIWKTPWEWLESGFRELFPEIQVVVARAVPMHFSPPPLKLDSNVRFLALPSNPKDERKMNMFKELESIPTPASAKREDAVSARRAELQSQLFAFRPNILHYVGHAGLDGEEGHLILESDTLTSDWVSAREFQRFLPPSVRLLCLATCVTARNYDIHGFAAFALGDSAANALSLPSIVFTQFPVTEQSSTAFWRRFYNELIEKQADLTSAVYAARSEVRAISPATGEWSSFVLVLRERFTPDVGHPFILTRSGVAAAGPDESTFSKADLQSYYASQLANQLEGLQSTDLPHEVSEKIKSQVQEARSLIQE